MPARRAAEVVKKVVLSIHSSPVSLDVGDASVEFFPEQVIQNIVFSLRSSQVSLNFNDTCLSSFAER